MDITKLIAYVLLQCSLTNWLVAVGRVLFFIGLAGLFIKSGIKFWWAFIPCAREYKLAQAAGMEEEGRVVSVICGLDIIIEIVRVIVDTVYSSDGFQLFLLVLQLTIELIGFIYFVRIYLGLIDVYDQKKPWILAWIFVDFLPALMWGWLKEYSPLWKLSDIKNETAAAVSGVNAPVLDRGLTVNLEERTATEFFKKKCLLRDIHMYIEPGHMVLLLGGSGAGKTTFVNAVNGYEKAKAEMVLNGHNMYQEYKRMQYDIGFVPQLDLMRGCDTVYRTLMDAAALRLPKGLQKAQRQNRVEEVMEIFGLTPVKNSLVVKLSGGQRKRLSIAMEFISNPTLFILDEPDSGLDGVMARELFNQLRSIADKGKIIIVITHTPDRVADLFDDVIVLAKDGERTGRLAYFGPIAEAREFFGKQRMEDIVKSINRTEEGGEGRADEFIMKYAEVQHG